MNRMSNQVGSAITAALFFIVACIAFSIPQGAGCGGILLIPAFGFGLFSFGIWYRKQQRNTKAVAHVQAAVNEETHQAAQTPMLSAPPMTSKGSGRLFVPEPLDRYR